MKRLVRFTLSVLIIGPALLLVLPAQAAFTSLYVFGDGLSTTTNNVPGGNGYFGRRFTNGRVWVEVLAERQGMTYESNKNWSYFGNYSATLAANVSNFPAPADASTALFVVWVNSADLFYDVSLHGTNLNAWMNSIRQAQTNHLRAINTLHGKGARTFIMPNAVDISAAPFLAGSPIATRNFIRQRVIDFNTAFTATLNQARSSLSNITIHMPDLFGLLDQMLANPSAFGLIHPGIDALGNPALTDKSLNGPGAHYLFWDQLDPTAKAHAHVANLAQQLLAPPRIALLTTVNKSNQLELTDIPVGRDGFVDGSANHIDWTPLGDIDSTNVAQTVVVPGYGAQYFYRLRFPFSWTWP